MWNLVKAARDEGPDKITELWLKDPFMAPAMEQPRLVSPLQRLARENAHCWLQNPVLQRSPKPLAAKRLDEIKVPTLLILGERDVTQAKATIDATGLVHEAYLKLAGAGSFATKSQFFRAAAQAMRRILIDRARSKKAERRGGGGRRFELSEAGRVIIPDPDMLLSFDEALDTLSVDDPSAAELARLRLFAGLSIEEAGESLGLARASAFRDWAYARAFLSAALGGERNPQDS